MCAAGWGAVPYRDRSGLVGAREGRRVPQALWPGAGHLLGAGCSGPQSYLLLHPTLKKHRHAGLDGEGNLPAADGEVLLQRLPERGLLHPGL